ncbi:hypothetical protein F7725_012546 [Dissostichus mawsoni]|uniref:Uncharacterized protein n=1 Tax=Dissostichus mawsoni TaxID=36200 RepID=A0A7J5YML9_DISMA|nr:hypothetical protein F7725_012546 [Dissostichus mawsoni]
MSKVKGIPSLVHNSNACVDLSVDTQVSSQILCWLTAVLKLCHESKVMRTRTSFWKLMFLTRTVPWSTCSLTLQFSRVTMLSASFARKAWKSAEGCGKPSLRLVPGQQVLTVQL